ncbi:KRAB-A domain-containing protein 2-like isoform X2 [Oopsacas minuta]|uniref:KRAB-A domain-containing protein 2-like isoform X2 n=1 Tax=Oopsacas minuta TaxID=111878 RepID=A0AAV7JER2_9METZ|nr:KRAB-A domain-containing protein 2-like isoform X2 [Oopsacas minuta]
MQQQFVFFEELFDIIHAAHLSTGHSGKVLMEHKLSEAYANITREHICTYLQLCEKCQLKKSKFRKSLVVKPIIRNQLNSRCEVDLIDMQSQPDDKYKYIITYQDNLAKFVTLKALESKRAEGVAYHLIDIL